MSQLDAGSAITGKPPVAMQTGTQISRRRILAVYKQMLLSLFIATLAVMGILIASVLPFFISRYVNGQVDAHDPPLLLIVVLAGALGAFFSVLMRLYNFEDLPKALVSPDLHGLPTAHLVIYSFVPAVVGAIAATVLYMLFASGLLRGDLFPAFVCKKGENLCTTFGMLIGEWGPNQATDYAKSIVWGFIAGFAERLVPDTLESLSRSAQKGNSGSGGGSNADAEPPKSGT
jgi:hypothetical protein